MPCNEWCRLVEGYRSAVNSYNDAVKALSALPGATFNEVWHRAERARTKSDRCRADLLHHEHDHGCLRSGQLDGDKQLAGVTTESLVLGDQGQSGG
jgi:hypothetical protein